MNDLNQRRNIILSGDEHQLEYYVRIDPVNLQVEAWSTRRLQFMPKGWQVDFRADLGAAIKTLAANSGQTLHAVYASPVTSRCDVENILIYNIGTARFSQAARFGLRFERAYKVPVACPVTLKGEALNYHKYSLSSGLSFEHWKTGRLLADFTIRSSGRLTLNKCAPVWYALKKGGFGRVELSGALPPSFGVRVEVTAPKGARLNLANVVKPVFDGVISALHQHTGPENAELYSRVAGILRITPDEVAELLRDDYTNVLGGRSIVHLFREGVQWNPADDLCVAGEILLRGNEATSEWSMAGKVVEVEPVTSGRNVNETMPQV